jgi:hypothetical protein
MRFHTIGQFGAATIALPRDANYVAVGIAPWSDVDLVLVGPNLLGPCALAPFADSVSAVRGFRVGDGGINAGEASTLALILYERCDLLAPPGPRASSFRTNIVTLDNSGEQLALRLPYSGRKQAHVRVMRRQGGTRPTFNVHLYGVTYSSPLVLSRVGATEAPCYREAAPVEIIAANSDGVTLVVGGGGDLQEGFDELEVFVSGTDPGDQGRDVLVEAEASGERGR